MRLFFTVYRITTRSVLTLKKVGQSTTILWFTHFQSVRFRKKKNELITESNIISIFFLSFSRSFFSIFVFGGRIAKMRKFKKLIKIFKLENQINLNL